MQYSAQNATDSEKTKESQETYAQAAWVLDLQAPRVKDAIVEDQFPRN